MIWNIILSGLVAMLFWSAVTYWATLVIYPDDAAADRGATEPPP